MSVLLRYTLYAAIMLAAAAGAVLAAWYLIVLPWLDLVARCLLVLCLAVFGPPALP